MKKVEFKTNSKVEKSDYNIYIDGKTDNVDYHFSSDYSSDELHKGKFANEILSLPGKSIPKNIWMGFDFKRKLIDGLMEQEYKLHLCEGKDTLALVLCLRPADEIDYKQMVMLNWERTSSRLVEDLKKLKGFKIHEDGDYSIEITMTVPQNQIIKNSLDKLLFEIEKSIAKSEKQAVKDAEEIIKLFK